jgi:hypothetical protein
MQCYDSWSDAYYVGFIQNLPSVSFILPRVTVYYYVFLQEKDLRSIMLCISFSFPLMPSTNHCFIVALQMCTRVFSFAELRGLYYLAGYFCTCLYGLMIIFIRNVKVILC